MRHEITTILKKLHLKSLHLPNILFCVKLGKQRGGPLKKGPIEVNRKI